MSDHGTVARQHRVTVPSPGCLVALLAPIVAVLIAALVLMVMHHRQERANERNEAEALNRTAALARSYARDVMAVSQYPPGQETVRGIAERHDGRLTSYARSEGRLATTVRFFGEFEDTTMFGTSYSRAYRCYSIVFREDAAGDPQEKTSRLEKCDAD
jgi:phosphate/sulfate permease